VLDVVIVTATGSREHVVRCLDALAAPPRGVAQRVLVADNASSDGVVALLRARFPEIAVHEMGANLGFAAAVNRGIEATSGPFVLLLNPDTVAPAGAIGRMLALLRADPGVAAVGPRLVDADGRPDHNAKRAFPTPAAALAHFTGGRLGDPGGYARTDIAADAVAEVDAISGSCMLVRRRAIEDVGLLDPGYWMYGEDLDWCRRMRLRGWRIVYAGDAAVMHVKHGVSGGRRSLRLEWSFHRAMGRFYRRYDAGANPGVDAVVYAGILSRFGATAAWSALRALAAALRAPGALPALLAALLPAIGAARARRVPHSRGRR
jgi:GT2 family glycosyltransferase